MRKQVKNICVFIIVKVTFMNGKMHKSHIQKILEHVHKDDSAKLHPKSTP